MEFSTGLPSTDWLLGAPHAFKAWAFHSESGAWRDLTYYALCAKIIFYLFLVYIFTHIAYMWLPLAFQV